MVEKLMEAFLEGLASSASNACPCGISFILGAITSSGVRSVVASSKRRHYLIIGRCRGNPIYGFVHAKNGLFSRNAFGTWNG
jgi:hypothetical protein